MIDCYQRVMMSANVKLSQKFLTNFSAIASTKLGRLQNSDFILESKIAELNQNKNSKQPDRPGDVWELLLSCK